MADWFRSWHGAPTDTKWLVIARNAGVAPGVVSAVFWALCDHASQQEDRGSVETFDAEVYAVWSGFDEEQVEAVIAALTTKHVIIDGRLAAWEKRQPKREDDSSKRVEAYRQRQREAKRDNANEALVTQRNAPEVEADKETEVKATTTGSARLPEVLPLMSNTERQVVDTLLEIPELSHVPVTDILEHYRSFPSVKRLNADDHVYEAMRFRDLWSERLSTDPKRRGKPWSGWKNGMTNFYQRSKPSSEQSRASPHRRSKNAPDYSGIDAWEQRHG